MSQAVHNGRSEASVGLPSLRRLFVFAVLLPAAVSVIDQLLWEYSHHSRWMRVSLYPGLVASTAVLSWCTGRYLRPIWLGWLVFGWSLLLLDFLTIAASLDGRIEEHTGYVLVSAQISLLVLWAILGTVGWQWRLPAVLLLAPVVIVFSGSFARNWFFAQNWNSLMVVTAACIALVSGGLRILGFGLQPTSHAESSGSEVTALQAHHFGLKHMFIWATALVPLLLVVRGVEFLILSNLYGQGLFPAAVLALAMATANLVAIWAVLGGGVSFARLTMFLLVPILLAVGLTLYTDYLQSTYGKGAYDSMIYSIVDAREIWTSWLLLNAALLAALLLFLRGSGYRLARIRRQPVNARRAFAVMP